MVKLIVQNIRKFKRLVQKLKLLEHVSIKQISVLV